MNTVGVADVAARLERIRRRIAAVDRRSDDPVDIVAVTKGWPEAAISVAVAVGLTAVGENYAQELRSKRDVIESSGAEVHFIGRLQTNKVRLVASLVDRWATVDRPELVDVISRRAPGARVLIQVDPFGTPGKGGCDPGVVGSLVDQARHASLVVEGLMCVGAVDMDRARLRSGFADVRGLCDQLSVGVCSMGMSEDFELAVAAGSTEVRIGTALFGPRVQRAT